VADWLPAAVAGCVLAQFSFFHHSLLAQQGFIPALPPRFSGPNKINIVLIYCGKQLPRLGKLCL
jgi:hypothetical protein